MNGLTLGTMDYCSEENAGLVDYRRHEGGCRPATAVAHPLVSIVVVVFRDRDELASVIDNVAAFRSPETEVVIIDGGSDDGTLELLRSKSDSIDYWRSEPDGGLYDGMNKAISIARGEFVIHINAGDRLLKIPLEELRDRRKRIDVLCGRVAEGGRGIWSPRSNWLMRFQNPWHHQGTFYRRDAEMRYDTQYRVFGDYDLNQRLLLAGKRIRFTKKIIAFHGMGGLSSGSTVYLEKLKLIRTNYGVLSYNIVRCLYFAQHHYSMLKKRFRNQ